MESFGLLRTNPNLTTNVKVVLSDDKLYFESFNSSASLGADKYKKQIIPQDGYYNIELVNYWNATPVDVAFNQKNLEDFDIMYSNYDDQIDDTYMSGGGNVEDTDYIEEFEYLAPVHMYPGKLPNDFIIFRVDGAGLLDLTSENFRSEILDKMKVVNRFDLSPKTKLGKFLDNSFNQSDLPDSSIEVDFNKSEFTYWNGVDYKTGQYVKKSKIMDSEFSREMTFTQGYDLLTNGFKDCGIIYPYIINLKFLFDDTPATPDRLKKWSINRYYGYYGNMEQVSEITPYKPPTLKSGLKLNNDNIFTLDGSPVDPFERGYKTDRTYYVEYLSVFYLISNIDTDTFKVISDIDLPRDVDGNYNTNTIYFSDNENRNEILFLNGDPFEINDTSDVILIEINGDYHRLSYNSETSKWYILSDYKFTVSNNIFRYYINKNDPDYTTVLNLNNVDINNSPVSFKIYRYNFNNVKDFDLDLLDTEFSKFEYEFEEDVTDTQEPKLYESDLNFSGTPKPSQKYLYKNKVVSIPVSSEFVGTGELFEVNGKENSNPNKFWVKNPKIVKWGMEGSLSNNDYPYTFNINSNADDYNRTTDTEKLIPNRPSRNMDYFYTMSSDSYNFGYTNPVTHQSLSIINNEPFDISKYFNIGYDSNYFDEIFGQNETYNEITSPRKKYSFFTKGDQVTPNQSLIKGINVSLYDIDSILTNITDGVKTIESLNVKGTNNFENYKMSILLSELSEDPSLNFSETTSGNSDWGMITGWQKNKQYYTNDIVLFDGSQFKDTKGQFGFSGYGTESGVGSIIPTEYIYPDGTTETLEIDPDTFELTVVSATGTNNGNPQLFECSSDTIITDPSLTLMDDANWGTYPVGYRTIFYKPDTSYTEWDQITASYSHLMDKSGVDINFLKYFVYYKGEYFKCVKDLSSSDNKNPDYIGISVVNGLQVPYWEKIEEYVTTKNYTSDEIVTMDNDLYYFSNSDQELSLIHTFKPIAKTPYSIYNIINFNDNLYIDRIGNSSLDNGINIYINKKWNNILVNIYFNDNMSDVYDVNREDLYKGDLQQLVASNFIDTINSITQLNGFINPLEYYIIESDDTYTQYNLSNIEDIPNIIQFETPVNVEYYSHSLSKNPLSINKNILKIKKSLVNNELVDISQINYYNDDPVSIIYDRPDSFDYLDKTDSVYRFNGGYNPIFNNISIFNNIDGDQYNFNENLNNFGTIKELIKSKVSDVNLLRVTDDSYSSIFPQVEEFGYFIDSHNIFKSTWDNKFYKKTEKNQ